MIKSVKILALTTLFVASKLAANAQLPIGLPVPKVLAFANGTYALPQSTNFTSSYDNGLGFEVGAGFGIGKSMIIASIGDVTYKSKTSKGNDLQVVPIKLGLRRYLMFGIFVNGNVGIAKETQGASTNSAFLYEAGAGIKFLKVIEVGAAYTGYSTANLGELKVNTLQSILFKAGVAIKL